jgi:Zn-dependent protease with chaperone function
MTRRSPLARMLALLLTLALGAPPLLEARAKPSNSFDMFSREQEVQVGRDAAGEVAQKMPLVPESDPLARYVTRLGQRLAVNAPGDEWPYSFHVVNQREINAFSLPGGPVYVNLGTIQTVDNEAELAGVLAHEIAHVVQRHATRAATRQYQAQIPLAILGSILGGRGGMGQLAQLGISFGVGSYFLRNSRQAESEADLVGADIMYDSGYDPHQLAVIFQKLQATTGAARGPQFLSDHPDPGNRAASVDAEVRTLPRRSYLPDSAEFRSMKLEAANMRPTNVRQDAQGRRQGQYGQDEDQLSRQDVAPSGGFRTFQHQAFRIDYPENWQVAGDSGSSLTIAPRGGVADNAVAYGVILDGFQPESGRESLDDATHQLLERLRQTNPQLRAIGSDESITVNGVAGRSIDLVGPSSIRDQQGRAVRERDWLVTLPLRNGDLLYLVFIAPEQDFGSLRSQAFEPMLRSLHLEE